MKLSKDLASDSLVTAGSSSDLGALLNGALCGIRFLVNSSDETSEMLFLREEEELSEQTSAIIHMAELRCFAEASGLDDDEGANGDVVVLFTAL